MARKSRDITLPGLVTSPSSEMANAHTAVIFTSFDGEDFEIPELPENLARMTALASEKTLSKIWGTTEEDEACHDKCDYNKP